MEYTGMKNVLKEFLKRIIKDDSTTTKNTWSASKINSEINNYVPKNVESIIGKVKLNGTTIEIECPLLTTGSANMQFFLSTDYQFSLDRKTNYTVKINGNIISTFTDIYANGSLCNSSQTSTGTYTFYKGKFISGFISSDVKKLYLRCDGYIQNASYAGNTARTTQSFDRFIAYSTTAAGTAAKVASCDNYALRTGDVFVLIITTSNTASSALTLNVNNRGAKTIYINGTVSSSTNKTLNAGTYFVYYNGTNYYLRTDGKFPVPFTASDVGAIKKSDLLDFVYPVGSIYMSVNNVSPQTFLGGTWTSINGRFLLGAGANTANTDNTYGSLAANQINRSVNEQGGEVKHTLTITEMPSHNHTIDHTHDTAKTVNNSIMALSYGSSNSYNGIGGKSFKTDTRDVVVPKYSGNSGSTGSGVAHNNMPPYLVVYMWKRTA